MKTIVTGSGGAGNAASVCAYAAHLKIEDRAAFSFPEMPTGVAQRLEHRSPTPTVAGSNPAARACPEFVPGNRSLLTPQWMTKMAQTSVRLRWVDRWTLDPEDRVRPPDGRRGCSTTAVRRLAMADTGVRLPAAARSREEACRRSSGVEHPPVERRAAGSIPVVGARATKPEAPSRRSSAGPERRPDKAKVGGSTPSGETLFPWRSWIARDATNVEVAGSNPAGNAERVVAQFGQRARFGTERSSVRIRPTRRDTSAWHAPLAQLVELPPLKRRVTGSTPVRRTARTRNLGAVDE
jgi:hypothetical protein